MEAGTAVAVHEGKTGLMASAVSPGQIVETIKHVHTLIREAMAEGIDGDYAVIPGTKKKTLLKPGAEKLLLAFGLAGVARAPQITDLGGNHREVVVETEIRNLRTGETHAVGIGSCSTLEKKYRYRPGPVEFTGKPVPREYWTDRKQELLGGPGYSTAKNPDTGAWEIVTKGAEVENPDPADGWNTVLKMASKRSMIDGVLRATASSAMFTQDMEDVAENTRGAGGNGSGKATGATPPPAAEDTPAADTPVMPPPAPGLDAYGGQITAVKITTGKSAKGPWTRYGVKIGEEWFNTFDKNIGEFAKAHKDSVVTYSYKPDGDYNTITGIALQTEREPGQD